MEEEEEQVPASTSQSQQSQEPQQSQSQSQDITIPQTGPGGREIAAAHEPTHPSHRETSLLSGGIGTPFPYTPYTPYTMETQQDTRVNVEDTSNIYDAGYDNWLMGSTLTPYNNRGGRTTRPQRRIVRRDILVKESNPIFATESRSRKMEIYLATPIIYITFMRIWLYKADLLPPVQPPEADTTLTTATGGRRLGVRVENYETYYRMEGNNCCDKCVYGCCMLCDRCCGSTYNLCCSCYEWDYVQCDCGICDCNGIIAGCCGSFFNVLYVSFNKFWLLD
ncbi:24874_t:CDS:2 [Cetraspora pellucida]|uniref:24874_t:CDS:1 n=1 Tax=Cetraspora pellucida TaxID=1433469 RepID=A0A9N9AI63_9GLOM|nr:24874_t:CDS:2 [Cetraspora pellucida]